MEGCIYKPRNAKEFPQPSEAGRGKDGSFPRVFRESMALQTP